MTGCCSCVSGSWAEVMCPRTLVLASRIISGRGLWFFLGWAVEVLWRRPGYSWTEPALRLSLPFGWVSLSRTGPRPVPVGGVAHRHLFVTAPLRPSQRHRRSPAARATRFGELAFGLGARRLRRVPWP